MTTVASFRNFGYEMTCANCGEALVAPEWSEYISEQRVLNLWSCAKCGCQFETEAYIPADVVSANDRIALEAFSSSLLVA
jgi:ribosomal protein L37AE/L43A